MIVNQLIVVCVFPMRTLISIGLDKILLPRYMNWSINFRGSSFNVDPSRVILCLGVSVSRSLNVHIYSFYVNVFDSFLLCFSHSPIEYK